MVKRSYDAAAESLEGDWARMVTFYDFPAEHLRHLRTTSVVDSPFAALRLRTDAAKRFRRVDRTIPVIWKMLMVTESRFWRLRASEVMKDIYLAPLQGRNRHKTNAGEDRHLIKLTHVDITFSVVFHVVTTSTGKEIKGVI